MTFWNDHKEVWRLLAAELDGRFEKGGWWDRDRVEVRHRHWTLTLDKYVVPAGKAQQYFTRLRAPFVNADNFRFCVYRKSIFTALGKALGVVQDIEVGDPMFDDAFVIQSASEAKVRAMLQRPRLRELIAAQPDISFEVKDDEGWFGQQFPEGVDELHFIARGLIDDLDQLKQLFELFTEVLDYLCSTGSAYDRETGLLLD